MDTNNAIRTIVKQSGFTLDAASRAMGKSDSWLSATVNRKGTSSKASTVARIADVCGYALALVPRESLPDGAIVIDAPGEG